MRLIRYSLLAFATSVGLVAVTWAGVQLPPTAREIAALKAVSDDSVKWDTKGAVRADVTCDGKADLIAVGYSKGSLWVGVLPSSVSTSSRKPMIFRFAVDRNVQEAVCTVPVRIRYYPIQCSDDDYGHYEGCRTVRGCSGFAVSDNECDPLEFYWDSTHKRLEWLRH